MSDVRLRDHVDRIEDAHRPIPLDSVDYTTQRPELVVARFGHVLDYMARVELEVELNLLELDILLPNAPEIDRRFYADVWHPQEVRHGIILDELQQRLGRPATTPRPNQVGAQIRILGALAHVSGVQDVARMLYYLTGVAAERSAVLAYGRLHDGLTHLGETALCATVVAPIRRQEPGHFAYYRLAAECLHPRLAPWQRWMVRLMRAPHWEPVGAGTASRRAEFGHVMETLGLTAELAWFSEQISRFERDLLWARRSGMAVPRYVLAGLRDAAERHAVNGRLG